MGGRHWGRPPESGMESSLIQTYVILPGQRHGPDSDAVSGTLFRVWILTTVDLTVFSSQEGLNTHWLAQLAEHQAYHLDVVGSTPAPKPRNVEDARGPDGSGL